MEGRQPSSKGLRPGSEHRLTIGSLNHAGEGVGRVEGRVIFVPGALPGEEVLARVERLTASFARGRLLGVLTPAPERRQPACAAFGSCGGCDLQHLSYPAQLAWKTRLVRETLARVGGLPDPPVRETLGMPEPWRYRNKVQLHPGRVGGRFRLGFYQERTHRVLPLSGCLLVPAEFLGLAAWLEERMAGREALAGVTFRRSADGDLLVDWLVPRPLAGGRELAQALRRDFPRVLSVTETVGRRGRHKTSVLAGKGRLRDRLGPYRFSVSPGAFLQVNTPQAEVLYNLAAAAAGEGDSLLELYSGVGVLSLFLAARFRRVLGVEVAAESVADARANAALNGMRNLEFLAGRAEEILPELAAAGYRAEAVVLDPPRAGAAPPVLAALLAMAPHRVVYISCHPATLARDLRRLAGEGYRVQDVQPVDMFPQTAHVETVVALSNFSCPGR